VFFFVPEWFGTSLQEIFLLLNDLERNSEFFSSVEFLAFYLSRKGLERNSELFPFFETDGILTD
jgi:hypothetical protein